MPLTFSGHCLHRLVPRRAHHPLGAQVAEGHPPGRSRRPVANHLARGWLCYRHRDHLSHHFRRGERLLQQTPLPQRPLLQLLQQPVRLHLRESQNHCKGRHRLYRPPLACALYSFHRCLRGHVKTQRRAQADHVRPRPSSMGRPSGERMAAHASARTAYSQYPHADPGRARRGR